MKSEKKELLIIVHGAKELHSRNSFVEKVNELFEKMVFLKPEHHPKFYNNLIKKLSSKNRKIIFFKWQGLVTKSSLKSASEKLKELIKNNAKKYKIKIAAFSMGAAISQSALEGKEKIDALLQIAAFNYKRDIKNAKKIINIFSKDDAFIILSMTALEPEGKWQEIKGKNVLNVNIPGFEHADFFKDNIIEKGKYKNKRIFDLYKEFLE